MMVEEYVQPDGSKDWLQKEKARLSRIGRESGQKFLFVFCRHSREDHVVNLGRFERPALTMVESPKG